MSVTLGSPLNALCTIVPHKLCPRPLRFLVQYREATGRLEAPPALLVQRVTDSAHTASSAPAVVRSRTLRTPWISFLHRRHLHGWSVPPLVALPPGPTSPLRSLRGIQSQCNMSGTYPALPAQFLRGQWAKLRRHPRLYLAACDDSTYRVVTLTSIVVLTTFKIVSSSMLHLIRECVREMSSPLYIRGLSGGFAFD